MRRAFTMAVITMAYLVIVFLNQKTIAAQRKTIGTQQATILSLQKLASMKDELISVSATNSVNAMKTISFFASMTTVQMLVEKLQNHEESLSWNAIWTATVEQYNATNPAKKLDPEKGVAEEDLKRARALEREHKRNRL